MSKWYCAAGFFVDVMTHPPPHSFFNPNLFVIPREFYVQNTVQTVAWKPREKMLKDIEPIASKSRENVEENL